MEQIVEPNPVESLLKIPSKHYHSLPLNAPVIETLIAVATRQVEKTVRQWLQKWIKNNKCWPKRCQNQHWKLAVAMWQHLRKPPWVLPLQICRKKSCRRILTKATITMVQVRNNSVGRAKKYINHRPDKTSNLTTKTRMQRDKKRLLGRKCKCWACKVEPQQMTAAKTIWAINRNSKVWISSKWAFWAMQLSLRMSFQLSVTKHLKSPPLLSNQDWKSQNSAKKCKLR